jgi:hypothetical protein
MKEKYKIIFDESAQVDSSNIQQLFEGDLINNLEANGNFAKFSKMYAFSTENLSSYFPKIDFKDKKVLTVSGSGDHAICSYLQGAKEVTIFDKNRLSGCFLDLKSSAQSELGFSNFQKFFRDVTNPGFNRSSNENAFDFEIYKSLRNNLSINSQIFFDNVYDYFNNDGFKLRKSKIFIQHEEVINDDDTHRTNLYLKSRWNYYNAKRKIAGKQSRWILSDIKNLVNHLSDEDVFDVVLLSNISDYIKKIYPDDEQYLQKFADEIIDPLSHHLNPKGIISMYVYDDYKNPAPFRKNCIGPVFRTDIDNPGKREQILRSLNLDYKEISFNGYWHGENDAVIVLQNRGK